ncbi:MAG: hypothetical protein HGA33_03010 [Candidatus Moranbacteria bacterium]|nr:hypothetical protein [Candidatus Moranbacteria bacterium]
MHDPHWYSENNHTQPVPDLEKRDKKLDFGGNYAGKWHASKDYLDGDGDDS